jgi:RNA polymerase sigma-70 factor (ECF subfamily)
LNRAVALAEVGGPDVALLEVEALDLLAYQPFHVVRAELLGRTGRAAAAVEAYDRAIELSGNAVERAHLERRRAACSARFRP